MTSVDSRFGNIAYLVFVYICTYGRILFRHGDSLKCFHLSEFQNAKIIF